MASARLPTRSNPTRQVRTWLLIIAALGLFSWALAWISTQCTPCNWNSIPVLPSFRSWVAFFGVTIIAAGLLMGVWRAFEAGERSSAQARLPRWLASLLIAAAILRLASAVLLFIALPEFGHGTPQELQGYVMADAHTRDRAAWKIAGSQKPIFSTFLENRKSDQYGGLLFSSALIYRYLGSDSHQPLLILVLICAISATTVLFAWGFSRRTWDEKVGLYAAIGTALYPEAILLSSALMREAILIPLAAAAFYGLARLRRENDKLSLAWTIIPVFLTLFISPPFTFLLAITMGVMAFIVRKEIYHHDLTVPRWLWLALAGLVVVVLLGLWLALKQFAPPSITNPVDVVSYWVEKSTDLQAHFSKSASGWVQKVFINIPKWAHLPFLVVYGVLRPFLPAALVVGSTAPIWPWITLTRAVGWTIVFVLLIYAFLRAWLVRGTDTFTRVLTLLIWIGILISSLRGGGDQDDNPRYRAVFAGLQVSLAAWAWVEQRQTKDPWLRRALVTLGFVLFWSLFWYLRRYYPMPWVITDPFKTIGLGLACGALFTIWDVTRTHTKGKT